MKREIIFLMPNTTEYRVVCRFGYNSLINFAWWGHIQKKIYYKKWIFFGKSTWIWHEVDSYWWSKEIETMDELKNLSLKLFDEKILLIPRLTKKAMEL